MGVSLAIFG